MNSDIELMVKIYDTHDADWMGDEIKSLSNLTRHHIIKKEDGGENNISNYALLTTYSHHLIHYLEDNNVRAYNELNSLFLELNRSCKPPTKEYFERVRIIVKRVKKDLKNKRRGR